MLLRLAIFFSAALVLAASHITALSFALYFTYSWLDIVMHLLGGFVVALGIGILPYIRIHLPPVWNSLSGYLILVLLVGVLWESFELWAGIWRFIDPDFFLDTVLDLCMDICGGVLGYICTTTLQKIESWHI